MTERTRGARSDLVIEDRLVLGAAVLLPWAYGGVAPWAFRTASVVLVGAAALSLLRAGWAGVGIERRTRWLIPGALLAVWAVLQLVPLPGGAIATLSPAAAAIHRATFPDRAGIADAPTRAAIEELALAQVPELQDVPFSERAGDVPLGEPAGTWSGPRALSLVPEAGWERVHWYLALLLTFVVVRRSAARPGVGALYRRVLFGLFCALAVFGLVHAATSDGTLYWGRRPIEPSRPFTPYVNPAHFAGVMELAVPWLAGAAIDAWIRARRHGWAASRAPLLVAAAVLSVVAGLATASKAAPVLLGASLAALALLTSRTRRARLLWIGTIVVVAAIAVVGVRFLRVGDRLDELVATSGGDPRQVDRIVAWGAALPMLRDFGIAGCGYGGFADVFPAYLPSGEQLRWEQMHNDFLEAAISGGAVGTVLLAWLVVGYLRRAGRAVGRARRRSDTAALGLAVGLATLAAHALVDFNHQIPANALLFVVLAALAIAEVDEPARSP